MKDKTTKYQNRIIAFIDILGFKDIIEKQEPTEIINSLTSFQELKDFKIASEYFSFDEPIEKEITIFSDTIIISFLVENLKENPLNLASLCNNISSIQDKLILFHGKFIRGSITVGDLYHKDNICFGPALIEAYKLESSKAIYPRVIIDEKVISNFSSEHFLRYLKFNNDYYFIDFFKLYGEGLLIDKFREDKPNCWRIAKTRHEIAKGLNNDEVGLKKKYTWLAREFNSILHPIIENGLILKYNNRDIKLIEI